MKKLFLATGLGLSLSLAQPVHAALHLQYPQLEKASPEASREESFTVVLSNLHRLKQFYNQAADAWDRQWERVVALYDIDYEPQVYLKAYDFLKKSGLELEYKQVEQALTWIGEHRQDFFGAYIDILSTTQDFSSYAKDFFQSFPITFFRTLVEAKSVPDIIKRENAKGIDLANVSQLALIDVASFSLLNSVAYQATEQVLASASPEIKEALLKLSPRSQRSSEAKQAGIFTYALLGLGKQCESLDGVAAINCLQAEYNRSFDLGYDMGVLAYQRATLNRMYEQIINIEEFKPEDTEEYRYALNVLADYFRQWTVAINGIGQRFIAAANKFNDKLAKLGQAPAEKK